jgi:hypothetical protein
LSLFDVFREKIFLSSIPSVIHHFNENDKRHTWHSKEGSRVVSRIMHQMKMSSSVHLWSQKHSLNMIFVQRSCKKE